MSGWTTASRKDCTITTGKDLYGKGVDILLFNLFIGQASAKVAYNWPLPAGEDAAGPTYPLPTAR